MNIRILVILHSKPVAPSRQSENDSYFASGWGGLSNKNKT